MDEQIDEEKKDEEQTQEPIKPLQQAEQPEQIELAGKKSRWWLWLIIALIVIGAGIGIYLLLSSGGGLLGAGGEILTPPGLPG